MSDIGVDGIAWFVREEHGTLYVSVHHEPWARVPVGDGEPRTPEEKGFRVVWANSVLSLRLDRNRPGTLTRPEDLAMSVSSDTSYLQDYADETYNEAHLRKRADSDFVRWHWGRPRSHHDRSVVRAYSEPTGDLLWTNEVDGRRVLCGAAEKHRAWLLTRGSTHSGRHTRLEVWDALTRTVTTLSEIDELDISAHRWPSGPRPPDHDSWVRWCISQLDGLDFSDWVSDVNATFVGDWPGGHIDLTYRHQRYPGLLISKRIDIYDEVGRKNHNRFRYGHVDLMEQADTFAYPDASLAVDGVLHA